MSAKTSTASKLFVVQSKDAFSRPKTGTAVECERYIASLGGIDFVEYYEELDSSMVDALAA